MVQSFPFEDSQWAVSLGVRMGVWPEVLEKAWVVLEVHNFVIG